MSEENFFPIGSRVYFVGDTEQHDVVEHVFGNGTPLARVASCSTKRQRIASPNELRSYPAGQGPQPGPIPLSVSELGKDAINPNHYTTGGIEVIDYLEAKLGLGGVIAYCLGNVIKYSSRAGKKIHAAEDMRKASWYATKAAELFDKKNTPRVA